MQVWISWNQECWKFLPLGQIPIFDLPPMRVDSRQKFFKSFWSLHFDLWFCLFCANIDIWIWLPKYFHLDLILNIIILILHLKTSAVWIEYPLASVRDQPSAFQRFIWISSICFSHFESEYFVSNINILIVIYFHFTWTASFFPFFSLICRGSLFFFFQFIESIHCSEIILVTLRVA